MTGGRSFDWAGALMRRKLLLTFFMVVGLAGAWFAFDNMTRLYRAVSTVVLIPQTISDSIYQGARRRPQDRYKLVDQETSSSVFREAVAARLGLEGRSPRDLENLAEKFEIFEVDFETYLFGYIHPDPKEAARRANAFAETFVELRRQHKLRGTENSRTFLDDEIGRIVKELEVERSALADYQSRNRGTLPGDREAHRAEQGFLRTRVAELEAQIESKQRESDSIRNMLDGGRPGATQGNGGAVLPRDPRLTQAQTLRSQLRDARLRYTEKHPEVIRLQASLDGLLEDIRARPYVPPRAVDLPQPEAGEDPGAALEAYINLDLERVNAEIEALDLKRRQAVTQIAVLENKVQRSFNHESTLQQMNAAIQLLEQRLLENRGRLQSLDTEREVYQRDMDERFELKARAVVPMLPFRPDLVQLGSLGLLGGLGLGIGLAFLLEARDRSVHTLEDVEALLGQEVIVAIPDMNRVTGRGYGPPVRKRVSRG